MELKHVMIEGLEKMEPEELAEVAADAATIHQMVMAEFAARDERNAKARAAAAALKPGGTETAPKKRGPKPRADAAARAAVESTEPLDLLNA